MSEVIFSEEKLSKFNPEYISPLVTFLVHESCTESGKLFEVGGGWIAQVR